MRGHFAWLLQSQCCHMAPGDIICHHIVDAAMRCICNKTSDGVSALRAYCNGNMETKLWMHLISCSHCWSACGRGSDGTPYVIGLRSLDSVIKRSATISHKSLTIAGACCAHFRFWTALDVSRHWVEEPMESENSSAFTRLCSRMIPLPEDVPLLNSQVPLSCITYMHRERLKEVQVFLFPYSTCICIYQQS